MCVYVGGCANRGFLPTSNYYPILPILCKNNLTSKVCVYIVSFLVNMIIGA